MSSNSGGRTKKRGRGMALTLAGSPLAGRNMKRVGKSPGPTSSPKSCGPKGVELALSTDESDIVLDRLEKEIVALLRAGGSKKEAVRRRLRLGINEVTKFLEGTAAAAAPATAAPSSAQKPPSSSTAPAAIVLVCRDVRPPRLVEHLHALVALTSTPHLVLSAPSGSLGRIFGCKTMAALAICPARCSAGQPRPPPPKTPGPPDPLPPATGGGGSAGGAGGAGSGGADGGSGEGTKLQLPSATSSSDDNRGRSGRTDGESVSVRDDRAGGSDAIRTSDGEGGQGGQRVPGAPGAGVGRAPAAVATPAAAEKEESEHGRGARKGGRVARIGGEGDEGEGGDVKRSDEAGAASDSRADVEEDVDSLVEFLRRKVRGPQPL